MNEFLVEFLNHLASDINGSKQIRQIRDKTNNETSINE